MNFSLESGLTIGIAFLAIIISVISLYKASRRDKRQLRIGRIEEIIEIVHVLTGNYQYYEDTFHLQQNIRMLQESKSNKEELARLLVLETKQISALNNISSDIDLHHKLIRLTVLINTYLPNDKLRSKIRFFVSLYTSLCESTENRNYHKVKDVFSNYPRPWYLLPFIEEIQSGLIKEMNLGYKNSFWDDDPDDKEFRKQVKI